MKRLKSNAKFKYTDRIASLVQRGLATVLQKSNKPLFVSATITHVDITPDLSHAKVFVTILDQEKKTQTITALNDSAAVLQRLLASTVKLRRIPRLRFIYDESIMRGQKLSALIDAAVAIDKTAHEQNKD
jgi:ribosome-binding factor A